MMRTKSKTLAVTVAVAMMVGLGQLVACGGGAPTTESIETHINTPTGNVDEASMATAFSQASIGSGEANGGVTPPTGTNSQPLTAETVATMTPQQTLAKVGVPQTAVAWLQPQLVLKQQAATPGVDPMGGLVLKQSKNPMECMGDVNLTSKNIDITMNMACLADGSGSIRIRTENIGISDMSQNPDEVNGRIQVNFNNACDDKGNCIDGHYRMLMDISKSANRVKLIAGYKLTVTAKGKAAINAKGGLRVLSNSNSQSIEIVAFAKDADGHEGSIILLLAKEGQTKSFAVKGANGSFSCQTDGEKGLCKADKGESTKSISWNLR